MVAVFLPLYRIGLAERDQRRLTILLAAMAALGVVGTPMNSAAGVFIVYAAALAGRIAPVRRAVLTIGVLAGLAGATFLLSRYRGHGNPALAKKRHAPCQNL